MRRLSALGSSLHNLHMSHPQWGFNLHDEWSERIKSVEITFRGALRQYVADEYDKTHPDNPLGKLALGALGYTMLLFIFKAEFMWAWGPGFALTLTWLCSKAGGELMKKMGLPGLTGNLLAGILLKNIVPNGDVEFKTVRGLPDEWASDVITVGLTIIFLRGGLEIDLELVKKAGTVALRLTAMPGVSEALTVACVSMILFKMNFMLGLSLGFILAAVSPAVVVGAMFELKKKGFGVKQNIPVLVVAAASFDDVVAISGFAICISFAIPSAHSSTVTTILHATHGPVTLLLGILGGALGAAVTSVTKVWDRPWKRTGIVVSLGFIFSFGAKRLEQIWVVEHAHPIAASTGILAALCMAGFTSYCWERGYSATGRCFKTEGDFHFAHDVESQLAHVWDALAQPLLFGIVGSFLDFRVMQATTAMKAITTVLCGLSMRTTIAFFATCGTPLKLKERLFVAIAWLPKATVQAAFAGVPLQLMLKKKVDEWDSDEQRLEYEQWGRDILTTAVLAILMTAPIGLILIQQLGPRWLEKDEGDARTSKLNDIIEEFASMRSSFASRPSVSVEDGNVPSRAGARAQVSPSAIGATSACAGGRWMSSEDLGTVMPDLAPSKATVGHKPSSHLLAGDKAAAASHIETAAI